MTENYFTQENVREMAKAIGALLGEACNARDQAELAMKWRDALEKIAYMPLNKLDEQPVCAEKHAEFYRNACVNAIATAADALGLDGSD